jgi:hypothetical protein
MYKHAIRIRWFDVLVGNAAADQGLPKALAMPSLPALEMPDSRRRHHGVVLIAASSFYKRCVAPPFSPLPRYWNLLIQHFWPPPYFLFLSRKDIFHTTILRS